MSTSTELQQWCLRHRHPGSQTGLQQWCLRHRHPGLPRSLHGKGRGEKGLSSPMGKGKGVSSEDGVADATHEEAACILQDKDSQLQRTCTPVRERFPTADDIQVEAKAEEDAYRKLRKNSKDFDVEIVVREHLATAADIQVEESAEEDASRKLLEKKKLLMPTEKDYRIDPKVLEAAAGAAVAEVMSGAAVSDVAAADAKEDAGVVDAADDIQVKATAEEDAYRTLPKNSKDFDVEIFVREHLPTVADIQVECMVENDVSRKLFGKKNLLVPTEKDYRIDPKIFAAAAGVAAVEVVSGAVAADVTSGTVEADVYRKVLVKKDQLKPNEKKSYVHEARSLHGCDGGDFDFDPSKLTFHDKLNMFGGARALGLKDSMVDVQRVKEANEAVHDSFEGLNVGQQLCI